MTKNSFFSYGKYYDLINHKKNYQKEVKFLIKLLKTNHKKNLKILEFGSGTGKHSCLLAKKGYVIHGVEMSDEMILNSHKHKNFYLEKGDITKIKIKRKFDAVISLFHVVSYQTSNSSINAVFKNARQHLQDGGMFIFDMWYSPAVIHQKPSIKVKSFENNQIKIIRIAEPTSFHNKNIVNVKFKFFIQNLISKSVETFEEVHSMRHFSLPEISFIAEANGFKLQKAGEFLTNQKPSEKTWSIYLVFKKNLK
jgi:SAM-dependent methyltransferase